MKKRILFLPLALALALCACAPAASVADPPRLTIAATTYPVYLFATAVAEGVSGVEVRQVVNQPTSCLHDYTLTVTDMKALEGADAVALSGVGLEDFMSDALDQTDALRIDCSTGVPLLPAVGHEGHDGHDHEETFDPHIWMSPANAKIMLRNLSDGFSALDPDHAESYAANCAAAVATLDSGLVQDGYLPAPELYRVITFHDGMRYFFEHYGFHLEKAVEEEEGSETSAREINEIVTLIKTHEIPAIFTEVNGSTATADAIAREVGVTVYPLSMIMSGDGRGMAPYVAAIRANYDTLATAFTEGGAP